MVVFARAQTHVPVRQARGDAIGQLNATRVSCRHPTKHMRIQTRPRRGVHLLNDYRTAMELHARAGRKCNRYARANAHEFTRLEMAQ